MLGAGCETREGAPSVPAGRTVQITFLHTSDWHSRLLPYDLQLAATDERLIRNYAPDSPILAPGQTLVQIGGLSRIATLIKRERARSPGNVLWVDSGDCFQGAPIFNAFSGEVETRALSLLGPDAVVIGNHEFDKGLDNLAIQMDKWATYPLLAANYIWERDTKGAETMARITKPYAIMWAGGLKVGVIGMANLSSLNSIGEGNNSLGITPVDEVQTVQFYIDELTAQGVDLIGITSHLGLTGHGERHEDYEVIERTTGLDFVFGGHLHVVLDPPQVRYDKTGRPVVLTHSGAFMKYLGRLDVVAEDSGDPYYRWEVKTHRYSLFPIDASVSEDPDAVRFLEPYILELNRQFDLTRIIAYAPRLVPRFGREKANSELGNIAAESMADRRGIQADFALTNTLGIRTDIIRGPITQDQMYNVFPFDNLIVKMRMGGRDVCELMSFVARRSAGRGCQPQAQFSDRVHLKMNCVSNEPECSFASEVAVRNQEVYQACLERGDDEATCDVASREPISGDRIYEVAVNDYIAQGGSGFRVLKFNRSRVPSDISIRDAVSDRFQAFPRCVDICGQRCDATEKPGECREQLDKEPLAGSGCEEATNCFTDVAAYQDRFCDGLETRDPRDWCDFVDRAPELTGTPTAEIDDPRAVLAILKPYCRAIRSAGAALEPGEVMEDDCFLTEQILQYAVTLGLPIEDVRKGADIALRQLGIPGPSDRCGCKLHAYERSDALCRELACVIGEADDRLEARNFENIRAARDAFAGGTGADLCAELALSSPCEPKDLAGIGQDEEPN